MGHLMEAPMEKANWQYWLDFWVYPLVGTIVAATTYTDYTYLLWIGAGVMLFTFMEYWAHRIFLHHVYFHEYHELHHTSPASYIVFPLYYVPAIFTVFFIVFPSAVFVGLIVGYMWFQYWHHILHHVDLNVYPRWIQRYALWHLKHHKFTDMNYGITHPLWDMVFGTYR
jgi:sterol desaturase/sphingolipid hydroxylase (fatty acid hydroxylase superfamily)